MTVRHDGNPLEALPVKQTENINLRIENNQETKLIHQKNSIQILESIKLNSQQSNFDNNEKLNTNDVANKTNGSMISNHDNLQQTSTPLNKPKTIEKKTRNLSCTGEYFKNNKYKLIIINYFSICLFGIL